VGPVAPGRRRARKAAYVQSQTHSATVHSGASRVWGLADSHTVALSVSRRLRLSRVGGVASRLRTSDELALEKERSFAFYRPCVRTDLVHIARGLHGTTDRRDGRNRGRGDFCGTSPRSSRRRLSWLPFQRSSLTVHPLPLVPLCASLGSNPFQTRFPRSGAAARTASSACPPRP